MNVNWTERLRACLGALVGLLATGLATRAAVGPGADWPLLIAPMGASAVLLFAAPASPLAQPWSIIGGNLTAALVGVTCARWIGDPFIAAAAAASVAIGLMFALRCLHPPSGAVALTAVLGGPAVHAQGYGFVLAPVLLNSVIILSVAILFNNLTRRRYPHQAEPAPVRTTADAPPGERIGFTSADLDEVLKQYNQVLDISRDDLDSLFRQAEMKAYHRRFGEITCADIMSRDVVAVRADEEVQQVWNRMRRHQVKAVPVIDAERRVVGIVTQTDFLTHANWSPRESVLAGLRRLLGRAVPARIGRSRVAADIMTQPVRTAPGGKPIAELVPLMSSLRLHQIPVVDEAGKLVGVVTQSDLVAGLYQGRLNERFVA